jgi:hypothetical protein
MTDQYRVEPFRPADAERVSDLFREIYGEGYPGRMVYHPDQMIAAFEEQRYFPFVVRDSSGEVIGFGALYRSAPYHGIYEFGQGVVSSHVRGGGIGRLLFEYVEKYIRTLPGSETYFGEAVCNHTHTQKAGSMILTIETGVEVDLMPGKAYAQGESGAGPVAVLDMFRSFVSKPHIVHVPLIYEEAARYIYEGFDDDRTVVAPKGLPRLEGATEMTVRVYESPEVARIFVPRAGTDFTGLFEKEERNLMEQKMRVIQVWFNCSQPGIGPAVEALRKRGYFFGGLFPRWFDEDGLLMQRITGEPNWEGIHLYSERAEKILGFIRDDWKQVRQNGGTAREVAHD